MGTGRSVLLGGLYPGTARRAERDAVERPGRVHAGFVADHRQVVGRALGPDVLVPGVERDVVDRIVDPAAQDQGHLLAEVGVWREPRAGSEPDEAAIRAGRGRTALEVDEVEARHDLR